MTDDERIYVAETTAGKGATGTTGRPVSLPVVELLTGRGFVTGKSGSGKSNTASVVAEELLDAGFGMLIVDVDGEYYGLKEEYEILHAGADEECDVQVTADHAEKLAALALEQNVPIILDVSGFLDDEEADAVLAAVAKHLFAKAKKQKQPFLVLVEEVHEYIPENGSVGEAGKMLIKIGKRGRKHGLGVCGISQRPADVKKDYITQCDWLVWHRLTWNNDTKVVRRVLDGEYASAVEDLDDGEGFLVTDWTDSVRRVQFRRKRTFDAGATPGLDDFERPDLKSVSDELVAELARVDGEQQARDDRIADLREKLDEKNSKIAELEAELQDARDMRRVAEQFTDALLEHVEGATPGRTEQERQRRRRERAAEGGSTTDAAPGRDGTAPSGTVTSRTDGAGSQETAGQARGDAGPDTGTPRHQPERPSNPQQSESASANDGATDSDIDEAMSAFGAMMDGNDHESAQADDETDSAAANGSANGSGDEGVVDTLADLAGIDTVNSSEPIDTVETGANGGKGNRTGADRNGNGTGAGRNGNGNAPSRNGNGNAPSRNGNGDRATADGGLSVRSFSSEVRDFEGGAENAATRSAVEESTNRGRDGRPPAVRRLDDALEDLPEEARAMLAHYREYGPATPEDAAGATAEGAGRTDAYAHNRRLRTAGLIEHVGRGHYEYSLETTIETAVEDAEREERMVEVYARDLEQEYLE